MVEKLLQSQNLVLFDSDIELHGIFVRKLFIFYEICKKCLGK